MPIVIQAVSRLTTTGVGARCVVAYLFTTVSVHFTFINVIATESIAGKVVAIIAGANE